MKLTYSLVKDAKYKTSTGHFSLYYMYEDLKFIDHLPPYPSLDRDYGNMPNKSSLDAKMCEKLNLSSTLDFHELCSHVYFVEKGSNLEKEIEEKKKFGQCIDEPFRRYCSVCSRKKQYPDVEINYIMDGMCVEDLARGRRKLKEEAYSEVFRFFYDWLYAL